MQKAFASEKAALPGSEAPGPSAIPAKGWWQIIKRVKREIAADNISLVAAGVAFYGMLSLVPLLIALVSVYGIVSDPSAVEQQVAQFAHLLPAGAREIITGQLQSIVSESSSTLRFATLASILAALWTTSSGVQALMRSLNIAYDEKEKRGFFALRFTALSLTLGFVAFMALALSVVAVLPGILGMFGLSEAVRGLIFWGRWPALAIVAWFGLTIVNRYGPSRRAPQWRWLTWGNGAAVLIWFLASLGFSFYVENFGNYNKTYGSLGTIIILLLWFYLSSFSILLGAEINSEIEHQTTVDTTIGRPKPMGQRGAVKADTYPGEPDEKSSAAG